jgi:hypothetical protein
MHSIFTKNEKKWYQIYLNKYNSNFKDAIFDHIKFDLSRA